MDYLHKPFPRRGRDNRQNWSILLESKGGLSLPLVGGRDWRRLHASKSLNFSSAQPLSLALPFSGPQNLRKAWESLPGILCRRYRVSLLRIKEETLRCYSHHLSHPYGTLFLFCALKCLFLKC